MQKLQELIQFIKTDIWRLSINDLSKKRAFLVHKLRILLLTVRCFNEDKCTLRGSALTFYVLMSIVPMAAMAFGIAKGFNVDKKLEAMILEGLSEQSEVISKVIEFARNILNETRGDLMAFVAVIMLFWTVIKVIGNIEISFNDIWGVKESRTIARKFSDYLSMMLLAPLCILIAGSLNIFVQSFFDDLALNFEFISLFSGIIKPLLRLLPLLFLSLFFTFVYILIPNTKVQFKSALVGGIFAAFLYQILQILYFSAQAGATTSSPIYGSFAALPLFLIWLQFSWYILLFGAELAFACQNVDTYIYESDTKSISPALKKLLTLQIVHLIIQEFKMGEAPETDAQIADDLNLPIRLVRSILEDLHEAGIISEIVNTTDNSITFQPARTIDSLSINSVIYMLDQNGSDKIPIKQTEGIEAISTALESFKVQLDNSPSNLLLKDM